MYVYGTVLNRYFSLLTAYLSPISSRWEDIPAARKMSSMNVMLLVWQIHANGRDMAWVELGAHFPHTAPRLSLPRRSKDSSLVRSAFNIVPTSFVIKLNVAGVKIISFAKGTCQKFIN